MRRVIALHLSLFFFASCIFFSCENKYSYSIKEARQFMAAYTTALRSGDEQNIKSFWSKQSVERQGFDFMHLWIGSAISISEWQGFLDSTDYVYTISDVQNIEEYVLINGAWKKPGQRNEDETDAVHPMQFYLIQEDERWVLMNPIDIIPHKWKRYETDCFIFIYPPNISINNHLAEMEQLDAECKSMCAALDLTLEKKIEYFKALTPRQCGQLLLQPPANGYAASSFHDKFQWYNVAVSTTFYNPHEVMHLLSALAGLPYVNAAFCEGIAVAYGGTTFQTAEFAHIYSRNALGTYDFISIPKLFTMNDKEFLPKSYITYQEAGSFVRFLIDTYGIDCYTKFLLTPNILKNLNKTALNIFGSSIKELEKNWMKALNSIPSLEVKFSIPSHAELIFSMKDSEFDDTGGGDYRYPNRASFVKGCCDLTHFEVYKDSLHMYFRVRLRETMKPLVSHVVGEKFGPGIVIALNKGEQPERHLFNFTNEVQFETAMGYDVKINAGFGINISNHFGKMYVSTKNLYEQIVDHQERTYTFSVPLSHLGEPTEEWRWFVGVGMSSDRVLHFSGLIPVPAIISGGKSTHGNPAFMDILLPESMDQKKILGTYNADKNQFAVVPMIGK